MDNWKPSQELTPENVKRYVNNGDKIGERKLRDFIALCEARQMDPFCNEIYIQGYGNKFEFYIGKDGTMLRARRIPDYAGFKAGWFWEDGTRVNDPVGKIAGAWAEVYVKGFAVPIPASALLVDYMPNPPRSTWKTHMAAMIYKCAVVAAHRFAYPVAFGGLYTKEELDKVRGEGDDDLPPPPSKDQGPAPEPKRPEPPRSDNGKIQKTTRKFDKLEPPQPVAEESPDNVSDWIQKNQTSYESLVSSFKLAKSYDIWEAACFDVAMAFKNNEITEEQQNQLRNLARTTRPAQAETV